MNKYKVRIIKWVPCEYAKVIEAENALSARNIHLDNVNNSPHDIKDWNCNIPHRTSVMSVIRERGDL